MKKVEEEIRVGQDIYFVRIQVNVCRECGERYYDRKTLRKLEEVEEKIKAKRLHPKPVGEVYRVASS